METELRLLIHDTYRPRGFAATGEDGNPSGPFHLSSQETVELPFPSGAPAHRTGLSHARRELYYESFLSFETHTIIIQSFKTVFLLNNYNTTAIAPNAIFRG